METLKTLIGQSAAAASVPGGRLGPTLVALIGLAAVVIGWRTFRCRDRFSPRPNTVIGVGVATALLAVAFLLLAEGGPGTGNGVVASGAAVVLGLAATALGSLARVRQDRGT